VILTKRRILQATQASDVPTLIKAAQWSWRRSIQLEAISALGRLRAAQAVPTLIGIAAHNRSVAAYNPGDHWASIAAQLAETALVDIGVSASDLMPALFDCQSCWWAVAFITETKNDDAVLPLMDAYRRAGAPPGLPQELKGHIIAHLCKIGTEAARLNILAVFENPHDTQRITALKSLVSLGECRAIPGLIRIIDEAYEAATAHPHSNPNGMWCSAALALARLGVTDAASHLNRLLGVLPREVSYSYEGLSMSSAQEATEYVIASNPGCLLLEQVLRVLRGEERLPQSIPHYPGL
jgi:hypothetical protein